MKHILRIFATIIFAATCTAIDLHAQPKAVSSVWSFGGIGLAYEHYLEDDCFIQADLKADLSEVFIGMTWTPGACASLTYNIIFASTQTDDKVDINYFGGPGLMAGWAMDYKTDAGAVFGIKGRIGLEAIFRRQISISACFSPVIGMHISSQNGGTRMRLYRNGVLYSILPEIGIKYRF